MRTQTPTSPTQTHPPPPPQPRQVGKALELYRDAGVPTSSFVGVPVFQAEGLTVTAQDAQYVPLFLAREDFDRVEDATMTRRRISSL